MPTLKLTVPSIVAYMPPKGFKIALICELADGSYEVTLEPSVYAIKYGFQEVTN